MSNNQTQSQRRNVEKIIADQDQRRRTAIYRSAEPLREMAERGELLEFSTVRQIMELNKACGSHWFDTDTMHMFGSKVYAGVYGGRFFVSSELDFYGENRCYTVRECLNGDIEAVGESYPTLARAKTAAKRAAASA